MLQVCYGEVLAHPYLRPHFLANARRLVQLLHGKVRTTAGYLAQGPCRQPRRPAGVGRGVKEGTCQHVHHWQQKVSPGACMHLNLHAPSKASQPTASSRSFTCPPCPRPDAHVCPDRAGLLMLPSWCLLAVAPPLLLQHMVISSGAADGPQLRAPHEVVALSTALDLTPAQAEVRQQPDSEVRAEVEQQQGMPLAPFWHMPSLLFAALWCIWSAMCFNVRCSSCLAL